MGIDEYLEERGREIHDGVFLRVFDPSRAYLAQSFVRSEAAYLPSPTAVATVVKRSYGNLQGLWPEMLWLYPEEVRLLASIALSVPEDCGALHFAPHWDSVKLPLDLSVDLTDPDELQYLRVEADAVAAHWFPERLPYELRDAEDLGDADRQALFDGIDLADELMVRGLHCMLKSQHLNSNILFGEDAFINIQIAREAGLEMIREVLEEAGHSDPSFADAHQYISDNFKLGEPLAEYFGIQHERWVATRHPKSRFGPYWAAPIHADDFFETYAALVSLYRHLLLSEPGRESACLD